MFSITIISVRPPFSRIFRLFGSFVKWLRTNERKWRTVTIWWLGWRIWSKEDMKKLTELPMMVNYYFWPLWKGVLGAPVRYRTSHQQREARKRRVRVQYEYHVIRMRALSKVGFIEEFGNNVLFSEYPTTKSSDSRSKRVQVDVTEWPICQFTKYRPRAGYLSPSRPKNFGSN